MNRRNAEFILDHNPRRLFPLVDDKRRLGELCTRIGVPIPRVYGIVSSYGSLRRVEELLDGLNDFVIKPNHGSAGRGIVVVARRDGDGFLRSNGAWISHEQIRQHLGDILAGLYSLGGHPDEALIQERVRIHPVFEPVSPKGIPDIRVILFKNQPAMAMLRLPTHASGGRANLHQGGIGAGIDLATGVTHHAVLGTHFITCHPDTKASVLGLHMPYWPDVLAMSKKVAEAIGLGYLGVDIIVDDERGPLLLEANARPGLAIQIANGQGLLPALRKIDASACSHLADRNDSRHLAEHHGYSPAASIEKQHPNSPTPRSTPQAA